MLCQMFQSIISGDLDSGITLLQARAPPIGVLKENVSLKFVYTPPEMRLKEKFVIIAHYETSY